MAPMPEQTTQIDVLNSRGSRSRDKRAFVLVRLHDRFDVRAVEPGKSVVLGRTADAEITIDYVRACRRHAELTGRDERLFVRDPGSRNGRGDEILGISRRTLQYRLAKLGWKA